MQGNDLEKIDEYIHRFLKELEYDLVLKMFSHLQGGKKLRSKLLLNIAGVSNESLKLCAIIELIHAASLLHDDVLDEAKLRRGAKSVNAEFGSKNAIMLGDILYSKAFYELSFFKAQIIACISSAVAKLSVGELMDIELAKSFNEDEKAYLKMIELKTAALIEASASAAAILAGLDEKAFGKYGRNLGLAFQIVDDILDVKNDENLLGKPAMSDFKEGKTTLVYMNLFKELDYNAKEKLKSLFAKDLNEDDQNWLKENFVKFDIIKKTSDEAKKYGFKALQAIKPYANSSLENFVLKMIDREF